jgi:diguanylate cyclase (GGDEF)-like protein
MPDGGWVATHDDITERCRVQAQIERMAHHDALTALPNRVLFRRRLNEALQKGGGQDQALAVLSIDLDRFKAVNDTLGHPVGDELLRAAARRLSECVRETDVVARLGGDEFAIIQIGAAQPAAAHSLAERLVRVIGAPFDVCGHQVVVGTSIGVALVPQDGVNADELLQKSDLALYDAKLGGRGAYSFFRPAMDEQAQSRRALERDLRSAVEKRQLELVYQPIIGLADRKLRSFEALLRWHHPTRGLVMPDQFIALAEETGLIEKIGAWVLRQALAEAARWPAHVSVAVNLSPLQLKSGNLLRDVTAALQASGLAGDRLEVEITESVPLEDNPFNLAQLRELRAHGVRIALDDFGIGYSSLGYLRTFPFSRIKIDRSFARDVASNRHAAAIVRAMTTLGSSLDMPITAEGIETEEQLQAVHALGCDEAQGYLISKPKPACELAPILQLDRRLVPVGGPCAV